MADDVQRALAQLTPRERACIVARHYDDLTVPEIAAALRLSEDKFRRSFEHASIGKSLTRPDGRLDTVNDALCRMLGYTRDELQARSAAEITHPEDRAATAECIRCLLAGERDTYRLEKRYLRKDGAVIWVDVSTVLLRDAKP